MRHASKMAGNSRKTIKDIAKDSILIMYIKRYLNVKVDEVFSIINNDTTKIKDASVVGKVIRGELNQDNNTNGSIIYNGEV